MADSALVQHRKLEEVQQFQQQLLFGNYILKWRQRHLFVNLNQHKQPPLLPPIESEQWLVECLKHSPVRLVRLGPNLGEARIKLWVIACLKAKMPVFLHLPSACKMESSSPLPRLSFRFIDLIAATLLLLASAPVILILALLISLDSPEPILLRQWGVSQRGRLFCIFKFRTTRGDKHNPRITWLSYCLCKYKLDKLPQLFNVLRGEMSLIEPRSCSLSLFLKKQL